LAPPAFPASFSKRASRIRHVRWDELQTRVRQVVNKRIDVVRYYFGSQPHPLLRNPGTERKGQFFFSADDLPVRARLLRDQLGEDVEKIIRQAGEITNHRFRLLGYEGLEYGPEIDWHRDAVNGIRAPLRPAHKIAFLDYSLVGDHKVIWELNRHQHLVTLAKAWVLTREEKYATELLSQWYSWKRANPYPLGINWASSLEAAFRSLSWLWVRFLLSDCPIVPATFEHDLLTLLALNGSFIERYLSTYFSPNTHLLGELTALFFIGMLCPQISKAEGWRRLGWNGLLSEANRQVRSDGVYFEQSLYYHVYALDLFLHARTLAAVNGMEAVNAFDTVLQKMLVFLQTMAQAGPPQTFGDDDGGRVFNPGRNRCELLTDPLVLGSVIFERADLATVPITEEAVWIFGERAFALSNGNATRPSLRSASFEDAGIYVIASSERHALHMVIDAGPMGVGQAGHGHADALSLTVSLDQRRWLIDPGTFTYLPATGRDRFRGTSAHNTWIVDGLDQADSRGPFAWSAIPDIRRDRWVTGETFTLFSAQHNGYRRLRNPVIHRRFVFHLQGRFWLVRDLLQGCGIHNCAISWHFAPDLEVQEIDDAFVAAPRGAGQVQSSRLALVPVRDSDWICEQVECEVSPVYGISEKAPVLRTHALTRLPAESAVMIVPLLTPDIKPGSLSLMHEGRSRERNQVSGYVYKERGDSHFMFFSSGEDNWQMGRWGSDADFLYSCTRNDELQHLVICGGSFAGFGGRTVCTRNKKVGWFEWLAREDEARAFSSDKNVSTVVSFVS